MYRFRYRPAKTFLIMALIPAALTALFMLSHYFGGCTGGYKSPVTCTYLPDVVGDFTLQALFFGAIFSVAWTLPGLAFVLLLETFVRLWNRKKTV